MEGIHGVDVSWLHHSPKGHIPHKTRPVPADLPAAPNDQKTTNPETPVTTTQEQPKSNGTTATTPMPAGRRTSLLHRTSSEKSDTSAQAPAPKQQKDSKPSTGGRKSSWVSSLSSKFSSGSGSGANSNKKASESSQPASKPTSPFKDDYNPFDSAAAPLEPKDEKKKPENPPYIVTPPESPSKAHGFLHNAMRRLSSSNGPHTLTKVAGHGNICPRKIMNIDPYRERCSIPDLEQKKLRRVAFCVDVEIAGSAQYGQDEAVAQEHVPTLSINDEAPLITLEKKAEAQKKSKEQQHKQLEGAVLKSGPAPEVVEKAAETESGSELPAGDGTSTESASEPVKEIKSKKEKKKKSEEERKHRKENRHRDALANGKIPVEIHKENESSSSGTSTPDPRHSPRAQDKPTTDPLRIYRRCCQLRETSVIKKIVEQISSPTSCPADSPGIVSTLDLSNTMLQLPDIVTLGDYLSVVPVKRLYMENCGLGNEAIRIILSGLLAAKTTAQVKFNRKLKKRAVEKSKGAMERTSVVEKVNLKNNPNIGKEGWKHIALFINLSRSLKAIDLSMIPFPQPETPTQSDHNVAPEESKSPMDLPAIFQAAISTRLAGDHFEELVMSSCNLNTHSVGRIIDAVIACKIARLGLASNNLDRDGLQHILRFLKIDSCHGLDIGGNHLSNYMGDLASAMDAKSNMWALSLADCGLNPPSLDVILPALLKLPNFRFLDLSHNRALFAARPSSLNTLRKCLPQFSILKRLHLMDVAMTPEHAIALAETLPECKRLAHINILENHLLSPLANAQTEEQQEEACAFYASFMAAVRCSDSLIAVDLDVPTPESSEIVKALAKQVVAYSLRNLEAMPLQENAESIIAAMSDSHKEESETAIPDVLLHLVGHVDGYPENHDNDPPAPDNDYIVGGTGLVKALDICLKRGIDGRKGSLGGPPSPIESGTDTPPQATLKSNEVAKGKAKDMSKNLLGSARKIRERLRPALITEARQGDAMNYRRLHFLDQTLSGIIDRFENEFPECRLPAPSSKQASRPPSPTSESLALRPAPSNSSVDIVSDPTSPTSPLPNPLTRTGSSRSLLASKLQAQEEGKMHRFVQRLRREILKTLPKHDPEGGEPLPTAPDVEELSFHDQELRKRLDSFEGQQIQAGIRERGMEGMLESIGAREQDIQAMVRDGKEEVCVDETKKVRELAVRIWREEWGNEGVVNGKAVESDGMTGLEMRR